MSDTTRGTMVVMRWLVLVVLATTAWACDPVNQIRVRFDVGARPVTVDLYWWPEGDAVMSALPGQRVSGGVFDQTVGECCGKARAYRDGRLRFVACVEGEGHPAELVCGKLPGGAVHRAPSPAPCDAAARDLARWKIDAERCLATP